MLFQIPGPPKSYIHQGATVQRTDPVPPVSQPDLRAYEGQRQMARYQVNAQPSLHQGATTQQTHPTPETSKPTREPETRQFEGLRQMNRHQVNVVPRFEGATVQATHPTPETSRPGNQPDLRAYEGLRQTNRYQPQPIPRLETVATPVIPDVFKTAQPEPSRFFPRWDANRIALGSGNVGPDPQLDGATLQQTHPILFVQQPRIVRVVQQPVLRYPETGVILSIVPDVFKTAQPEPSRFWPRWDANRVALGSGNVGPNEQYEGATNQDMLAVQSGLDLDVPWIYRTWPTALVPNVTPALFVLVGPSAAQTHPTPGVSQPTNDWFARREFARRFGGPAPQFEGATIQQGYVFPVSQPDMRLYPSQAHRYLPWPVLQIPQAVTVDPRYDLYPAAQPDLDRFARQQQGRYQVAVVPRFEGATTQDWFLYPTSQPDMARFNLRELARKLGGPMPQLEGPTIQQGYVFPISQPDARFYPSQAHRYLPWPVLQIPQAVTVDPRYDLYPAAQPELVRLIGLREWARRLGGPTPLLEGATLQQGYVFPVSQSDMRLYPSQAHRQPQASPPRLENPVAISDWFRYQTDQPDLARFALREVARRFGGPIAQIDRGASIQQTYIFPPNQPEMIREFRKELARTLGGPAPQIHQGAAVGSTVPIPSVSGTTLDWFLRDGQIRKLGSGPHPFAALHITIFVLGDGTIRIVGSYQHDIGIVGVDQTNVDIIGNLDPFGGS